MLRISSWPPRAAVVLSSAALLWRKILICCHAALCDPDLWPACVEGKVFRLQLKIIFIIDSTEDYCLNQLISLYNVTSGYFAVKQRKVANPHIGKAGFRENLAFFLENDNNLIVEITVEAFSSTKEVLNCVCLFVCSLICQEDYTRIADRFSTKPSWRMCLNPE